MKTLHLYLTRQVLATLIMTVAVFTFVLLLGNALKEILLLLIQRQATFFGIAEAFGLLLPWVLVFALPMGLLTASLLVFGRFSADQELTAVRASGISLLALISPILILSLVLSVFSAWINLDVAPRCRVAYKKLTAEMGVKLATSLLPEGRYTSFPHCRVYVREIDRKNNMLYGLYGNYFDDADKTEYVISAARGRIVAENGTNMLYLYDVGYLSRSEQAGMDWSPGSAPEFEHISLGGYGASAKSAEADTDINNMTFAQLRQVIADWKEKYSESTRNLTLNEAMRWKQQLEALKVDPTLPARVQMHRQVAFSFACFGFTLIGIPLGIRAHRRETNVGIAIALGLAFTYYSFIIVGQSLQFHAELAPHLIMWIPNFLFQAIGAVMLWRANRGI